jgi:hypothetical protein
MHRNEIQHRKDSYNFETETPEVSYEAQSLELRLSPTTLSMDSNSLETTPSPNKKALLPSHNGDFDFMEEEVVSMSRINERADFFHSSRSNDESVEVSTKGEVFGQFPRLASIVPKRSKSVFKRKFIKPL